MSDNIVTWNRCAADGTIYPVETDVDGVKTGICLHVKGVTVQAHVGTEKMKADVEKMADFIKNIGNP